MSHTMYIYTHSKSPLKEKTFKIEVTDQTSNAPGPRPFRTGPGGSRPRTSPTRWNQGI